MKLAGVVFVVSYAVCTPTPGPSPAVLGPAYCSAAAVLHCQQRQQCGEVVTCGAATDPLHDELYNECCTRLDPNQPCDVIVVPNPIDAIGACARGITTRCRTDLDVAWSESC